MRYEKPEVVKGQPLSEVTGFAVFTPKAPPG